MAIYTKTQVKNCGKQPSELIYFDIVHLIRLSRFCKKCDILHAKWKWYWLLFNNIRKSHHLRHW